MNQLFFELIRVAIGTADSLSHTPSQKEWKALYDMAKKQSLVGVCFAALQRLGADADEGYTRIGMSEMLYFNWIGMAATIQKKNEIVNRQCAELQAKLFADGFHSCILKGQGVSQLYPEHLRGLRQSGDIDVWIDAPKNMVIDYVMKMMPTKVFDQKHIHYNCFEDTDVEVHWIPVKRHNPLWNRILKKYFSMESNRQFRNNDNGLCVPTTDFQLVHQLLHVYSH